MKNISSWLLVGMFLIICGRLLFGQSPPYPDLSSKAIFVQCKTNWISVDDLDKRAQAYLQAHDNTFRLDKVGRSAWIQSCGTNEGVLINYNSGMWKHGWNVYIDSNGTVSRFESGIFG